MDEQNVNQQEAQNPEQVTPLISEQEDAVLLKQELDAARELLLKLNAGAGIASIVFLWKQIDALANDAAVNSCQKDRTRAAVAAFEVLTKMADAFGFRIENGLAVALNPDSN